MPITITEEVAMSYPTPRYLGESGEISAVFRERIAPVRDPLRLHPAEGYQSEMPFCALTFVIGTRTSNSPSPALRRP